MTTITEQQTSPAQLLTNISSALTGQSNWSDADNSVTNDQSSDSWDDNGRVLEDTNTGQFVLMYVTYQDYFEDSDNGSVQGIRVVRSDSWDTANSLPSGNQTTVQEDAYTGNASWDGTKRIDSMTSKLNVTSSMATGIWWKSSNRNSASRSDFAANSNVTHFGSARPDGYTVAAWDTADGADGAAGWIEYSYANSKFWNDSETPVWTNSAYTGSSEGTQVRTYAYNWIEGTMYSYRGYGHDEYQGGGIESGAYGKVNSASTDDTFFVRYATVHADSNSTTPIHYAHNAIRNKDQNGGSHGDTVTYDGKDYRLFEQTGAGQSTAMSAGIRYE